MRNPIDWRWLSAGLLLLLAVVSGLERSASAAPERKLVLVVPIRGMIDLGLGPFVERVLEKAEQERAAALVLEIDTFGGRVDAAVAIRDTLLKSRLQTVAFVNPRAISAGALITLACEKVVVARGATIGAATPVEVGGADSRAQPASEKMVSYVRKEFRATADARKRPGLIAEAMVDADVSIPSVIEKGKLLTLTSTDSLQLGVADFEASDLAGVLRGLELTGAELRYERPNWAEGLVRFLTQPIVSSLLMTLGMLGVIVELRTPGFGVPGVVGFASLALFFWGHWLVNLAGFGQLMLLVGGAILIAVEVLLLPGFGVAGVLGIVALLAALSTSLYGTGASWPAVLAAISRVLISTALAAVAFFILLRFIHVLPGGQKLVLASTLTGDADTTVRLRSGMRGLSLTLLRPSGIADFEGRRVDVVSQGEFLHSGQELEIVRDEGHRVVVRAAPPGQKEQIK
jgi:membrane-bound serine protease (ClpP class)